MARSFRRPRIGDVVLYRLNNQIPPLPLMVTGVDEDGCTIHGSVFYEGIWTIKTNLPYSINMVGGWGFQEDFYTQGDLNV